MANGSNGFTSAGERLRRHWTAQNVDINPGVLNLNSFEAKNQVVLPKDLRDYFYCVNGMPADVVDDGVIRFWMLDELQSLPQGAPAFSDQSYIQNHGRDVEGSSWVNLPERRTFGLPKSRTPN